MNHSGSDFFALLELIPSPAVAARGGEIVFANAAALRVLPRALLSGPASALAEAPLVPGGRVTLRGAELSGTVFAQGKFTVVVFDGGEGFSGSCSEFASAVAENIKSPLSVLLSAADLMLPKVERSGDPSLAWQLSAVYKACFQLRRTAELADICTLAAGEKLSLRLRNADLVALIGDLVGSVAMLTCERGVKLAFKTPLSSAETAVDCERIEQALLNLLSNSLRHTPAGGQITVKLDRRGEIYAVSVEDDGCGIPPEKLADIFTPKARPKALSDPDRGLGLGLPFARLAVVSHGGSMVLNSRPGKGTEVRFSLPVRPAGPVVSDDALLYGERGLREILTWLSDALPADCYEAKYLD